MGKFYTEEPQLTYDDVLLVPRKTTVKSRTDVDLSVSIGCSLLKYPIMSAAMDTVTGGSMAKMLGELGGMGIVHRFQSVEDRISSILPFCYDVESVGIAVGLDETEDDIIKIANAADIIALDVAHAHADYVIERTKELSEWLGDLNV